MRGVTVALIVVALGALGVSFYSSARARSTYAQTRTLRAQMSKVLQEKQALEQNLRDAQARYDQESGVTQELKTALAHQQERYEALAEQLEGNAQATARKTATSNIVPSKDR